MIKKSTDTPPTPSIAAGLQLHQQGKLNAAKACYEAIIAEQPNHADAIHLLGIIYHQSGQQNEAIRLIEKAIAINDRNPFYYNNLGSCYLANHNTEHAKDLYQKAIELKPDYVEAINNLGDCLHRLGKADQAILWYDKALTIDNNNYEVHHNLACAYQQLLESKRALQHYQRALQLNPNHLPSLINISNLLSRHGNVKEAIGLLKKALNIDPQNLDVRRSLGMAFVMQGELQQAEQCFQQVLQVNPNDQAALAEMAVIKGYQGNTDETEQLCHQVLAREPKNIQALCTLADLSLLNDIDATIITMEQLLEAPQTDNDDKIKLHFHLATLYERQHKYQQAFSHYQQSNQLKIQLIGNPFDLNNIANRFQRLMDNINADFFSHRKDWGNPSNQPIFVVGMPRSGTSLVEQILASHSQVFGAGELTEFKQFSEIFTDYKDPDQFKEALQSLNPELVDQLAQTYLEKIRRLAAGKPYVVDKMPNNFETLWLIHLVFPNARIVHCQRDPMDTCLSCYFTNFSKGHHYKHDLATLGGYYNLYQTLTNHWLQVLPKESIINIGYENLVRNPEPVMRELVSFCGLPWEDNCLNFFATERVVKTASYTQVKENLYQSSIGRWRHYADFLTPLQQALDLANEI